MQQLEFKTEASMDNLPVMVDFIREKLLNFRIKKNQVIKTVLLAEDMLVQLIEHRADEKSQVIISLRHFLGKGSLVIKCRGSAFELEDTDMGLKELLNCPSDNDEDAVVRSIVRKNLQLTLSMEHVRTFNVIKITFDSSKYQQLIVTFSAMVLGLLTGFILKETLGSSACEYISENVFSTISTMFLNAIKMIVGPLIFFSVASSVAGMGDIKSLGRLGAKVFLMYLFTSILAILLAYGIFNIFPMGNNSLADLFEDSSTEAAFLPSAMPISMWKVIQDIVPSNFLGAFTSSNMLQLLFLAFLLGIISTVIGDASQKIKGGLDIANIVFTKIAAVIMKTVPLAIFSSMAKLMLNLNPSAFTAMLQWIALNYISFISLAIMYGLLILFLAHKNPFIFYKKYFEPVTTAIAFNASAAALPSALKACRDKLGISSKVYSFSIPLGNTINMDGCCAMMLLTVLFFAKSFGIEISPGLLCSMMISIYLLSVGSPGVPMGALVCVSLLMTQAGIPKEALGLVIGLYPIVAMFMTGTNVLGDGAVTLIVANSEKLIDEKIYNGNV